MEQGPTTPEALDQNEAIGVVAASARRLFPLVSEQQAREMASLVLRDLKAGGISLVRNGARP